MRRVQGLTAGTPGGESNNVDDNSLVCAGDPLVIYSEKKTAIANIKAIKLGNQNKKFINVDNFQSKNLFFDVHPLDLTEHDDKLYWNGSFVSETQKVPMKMLL